MKKILLIILLKIPFAGYSQIYFKSCEVTTKKHVWMENKGSYGDQDTVAIDSPSFAIDISKNYLKKNMTLVTGIVIGNASIRTYKNGELISYIKWWPLGCGHKQSENNFKDGKFHGIQKRYFEKNILKSEQEYENGKRNGKYREWDKNGILRIEAEFKNDQPVGVVKRYFSNGNIERESFHHNRDIKFDETFFGPFDISKNQKWYYENGMIKTIWKKRGIDGNGKKIIDYYKTGEILSERIYENREIISKKCWDNYGNETKCE